MKQLALHPLLAVLAVLPLSASEASAVRDATLRGRAASATAHPKPAPTGAGWHHEVFPDAKAQFHFNGKTVGWKTARPVVVDEGTVLPSGRVLQVKARVQVLMFGEEISSVSVSGDTVTITGTLYSQTTLTPVGRPNDFAVLGEFVPFTLVAMDHGTPGNGLDTVSLSVTYVSTPDLDHSDLFGNSASFGGSVAAGNVKIP